MKIVLTEGFQKDLLKLDSALYQKAISVLMKLPQAIKNIHSHSGAGLRKIHSSGIYEARLGLHLRLIFGYKDDQLICKTIGNHEQVQRFLRNL